MHIFVLVADNAGYGLNYNSLFLILQWEQKSILCRQHFIKLKCYVRLQQDNDPIFFNKAKINTYNNSESN